MLAMSAPSSMTRMCATSLAIFARVPRWADWVSRTTGGTLFGLTDKEVESSTPALIVPREEPRREQLIRARALRDAGAVDVMRDADLDVGALTRWVARAVTRRVLRAHLRRDGLRAAAARAAALLRPDPSISHRARQERAS